MLEVRTGLFCALRSSCHALGCRTPLASIALQHVLSAWLQSCQRPQRKLDTRIVNSGKRMRHEVITQINSTGTDMAVQCSEKNLDDVNTYQSFGQVRLAQGLWPGAPARVCASQGRPCSGARRRAGG